MSNLQNVDIIQANIIASGLNKKNRRIVNGFGSFMGSKEITESNLQNDKSDSDISFSSLSSVLIKDEELKKKYTKLIHISEQPWTFSNWYKHINWLNTTLVLIFPFLGILSSPFVPVKIETMLVAIILYVFGGLSITAGYHRLWAHKAYDTIVPIRLFFALFGASAIEGSIKWWGHNHRIHHRYTDTSRDPHDARKGFWYSHYGWMLLKPNPKNRARADISDLVDDWVVRFQHRHFLFLMFFMSYVFPCLICGIFFNDYIGGFLYAGMLRAFCIQQATFCVNSLAHWIGVQPFDDKRTPRDHFITALVTFGEGYHNFHHEFPSDYRSAIYWYQYDPTKLFIWICSKFGIAYNLKKFSQNAIDQGLVQQQQKKLDTARSKLGWGIPLSDLPIWDNQMFLENNKANGGLVIINGIVHDVTGYISQHPGGEPLLRTSIGKDATRAFNGGVYGHSNAAHNLLFKLRVAVVKDFHCHNKVSNSIKNKFSIQ